MTRDDPTSADVTFPARKILLLVFPSFLAIQAVAISFVVLVATVNPLPVTLVAGLGAAAVVGGAGLVQVLAVRGAFLPVRLDDHVLLVPRPISGVRRIPLTEVAGLGMQYVPGGRGSGWRPYVWTADGSGIRLNIPPPEFPAPKAERSRRRIPMGSAPSLNWDYVAASPAGQAAVEISHQVLQVQGESGPWRSLHRETLPFGPRALHSAFWSPSGAMGVLPTARSGPESTARR